MATGLSNGTGGYDGEGGYTYFWTGKEVSAGVAWSVGFFPDTDDAILDNNLDKSIGMPVRCVRKLVISQLFDCRPETVLGL